jgi:hypothetical protein
MNDENNIATSDSVDNSDLDNLLDESEETLEITINKATKEATLRNPKDNRVIKLKASFEDAVEEIEDEDEDVQPLTPEQFEDGIKRLDALGLTFSVDLFPSLKPKDESSPDIIDAEEYQNIQDSYPILPREVGLAAHNTITGNSHGIDLLGGREFFERKSEIVERLILTDKYREDFFFQHALKVPYFESIDWEINLKTHENGVKSNVSVPYALLMLSFHNTNPKLGRLDVHQNITVAANRALIEKLLVSLTEAKLALEESEKMREILRKVKPLKE